MNLVVEIKGLLMVFGIKGKTIQGPIMNIGTCPSCDCSQFHTHGVLKYFHLYWVPMFIVSKKVGMQCTQCNQSLIHTNIPRIISNKIKSTIFNKKHTTPFFAGPIILFALVVFIAINVQLENINQAEYINNPMIDDIYIINLNRIDTNIDEKYNYGAIRVKNIFLAKVEFQVSISGHDDSSGVREDIRSKKASEYAYYNSKLLYIAKERLPVLKKYNAILSIKRNY